MAMVQCSFDRPHHQAIATVLQALNADLLANSHCLFGGGTAIALHYGEYRESVDIDFLISDLAGYRSLRQLLTGPDGLAAIAHPTAMLRAVREIRADQYGIRTIVGVGEIKIKFEIVLEARIQLESPDPARHICGVATITPLDMLASKLLANSDRWADDSVFSRDLIDIAMMQTTGLLEAAIEKAAGAYGASVQRDLVQSVSKLLTREGRLEQCMTALKINTPKVVLWQRLQALTASTRAAR
jgi:hypothetical protein